MTIVPACGANDISIHALLAESDLCPICQWRRSLNFYPRSPCGERPTGVRTPKRPVIFLSTLSLRRATGQSFVIQPVADISIHALLAESDIMCRKTCPSGLYISIHALLAESDQGNCNPSTDNHISIHALLAESDILLHL